MDSYFSLSPFCLLAAWTRISACPLFVCLRIALLVGVHNAGTMSMNDHIGRYATTDHLAVAIVRAQGTVATIADQHQLRGTPRQLLGQSLVASLLLATRLKGQGVLSLSLRNTGGFAHVRCDAIGMGQVRGMVTSSVREQLQSWNGVDPLLQGELQIEVSKQLSDEHQPYRSLVSLPTDSIPLAINGYLAHSEQIDACMMIDCRVNEDAVVEATGVYLERLPGAADEDPGIDHLHRHQQALADGHPMGLAGDRSDHGLLQRILPGCELIHLKDYPARFFCPCSADRFREALRGLAPADRAELADNGIISTECEFCRSVYHIPIDEL
ncbi:MAG: Hsp33 family molecular chaperone HslO [Planctomycetota bacterium]|nr:MAG: Hsp33 family molecular chaperone HslO [Planctomycetota bacterium]